MGVLRGIGYVRAAIAVLTVLGTGSLLIIFLGILGGLLFSLITGILFTASAIRAYFEESKTAQRSDLN